MENINKNAKMYWQERFYIFSVNENDFLEDNKNLIFLESFDNQLKAEEFMRKLDKKFIVIKGQEQVVETTSFGTNKFYKIMEK